MPEGYQVPGAKSGSDFLSWRWAHERLVRTRNYWVATAGPGGRPHAMPVWGVWADSALFFGTDRGSRKGRNLAVNPVVVVHLESGDEVVILEGAVREVPGGPLMEKVDRAYFAKYKVRLTGHPGGVVVYQVRPRVAFGWRERDFVQKATRWRFGDS